jgi:HK97 family phage major capsid protein
MTMDTAEIVREFKAHHTDVKAALEKAGIKDAELDARMLEIEQKVARRAGGGEPEAKSMGEIVARSDEYQALAKSQSGKVRIKTTITTGSTSGGALAPSDRKPGPNLLPRRRVRFRDVLTPGTTMSTSVEYPRQTGRTNNAATVAEGATKPESALAWETVTAPTRTIANTLPASKQILDDAAMLQSIVDGELRFMHEDVEELQLLMGDGSGTNLSGVYPSATAFSPVFTLPSPTWLDVLLLAIAQTEAAGFEPDSITLNPLDYAKILAMKDSAGNYIDWNGGPFSTQQIAQLWMTPIVKTQAMTAGNFMVGSSVGAQVFDRQETTVEISTEHSDFFARNLVLLRCEARLALAVYRPTAFTKGTFATAVTAATDD